MKIAYTHMGEPVPASRPRVTRWGTYNTPRYESFKSLLASEIALHLGTFGRFQGYALKLYAEFHRKSKRKADIDNFLKALMDSIQDSGIIENDTDIKHVEAKVIQVQKNPMIYFELERVGG